MLQSGAPPAEMMEVYPDIKECNQDQTDKPGGGGNVRMDCSGSGS